MSQDKYEIVKMAREAGAVFDPQWGIASNTGTATFERFAALCRAPLVAEVERLTADLEQTRVQLAGCGVAAMQNTEESKAHRVERGAYGWSESYGDVCRMVDSEIELRAENARLKDDCQHACKTVAEMHAAAVGQIVGPNRGVVEDVTDLRTDRDDWKARAEAAEAEIARVRAGKPFGWYSAKENDFMLNKIRKAHERLNSRTHRIGKYDTALFTAPQPAAQESPSAVPVVEQLVEAFDKAEDSWMRKAIELEAEVAKLRGLVSGRSAEYLAAHITYDKGYQEGRLDAESLNIPVAEVGVSIFTWLGDRPPAGTTLYRIDQL